MSKEVVVQQSASAIELALIGGDLSKLSPDERLGYYKQTCESLGLNPLTKPFDYINLNGKLTLYARKDATEQLRKIYGVSITSMEEKEVAGVYIVTVKAEDKSGRTDMAKGAVTIKNLQGDALANATMKAETKAKRRVTLSICGLGMLDETEIETIKDAVVVDDKKPDVSQAQILDKKEIKADIEAQNKVANQVFKDDNISLTTAESYVYNLAPKFKDVDAKKINERLDWCEAQGGKHLGNHVWAFDHAITVFAEYQIESDELVEQGRAA